MRKVADELMVWCQNVASEGVSDADLVDALLIAAAIIHQDSTRSSLQTFNVIGERMFNAVAEAMGDMQVIDTIENLRKERCGAPLPGTDKRCDLVRDHDGSHVNYRVSKFGW